MGRQAEEASRQAAAATARLAAEQERADESDAQCAALHSRLQASTAAAGAAQRHAGALQGQVPTPAVLVLLLLCNLIFHLNVKPARVLRGHQHDRSQSDSSCL